LMKRYKDFENDVCNNIASALICANKLE